MVTAPNFYNLGDQAIYSAGDFFIPQERFRAAPYNVNTPAADDPAAAGLPAVYRPQGSGGGGGDYAASLGLGSDNRGFITSDFTNFEPNYSYTPPAYDDFPPQQNMFQKAIGSVTDTIKDKAAPIFGGILSAATGVPFLGSALEGITGKFENRPLGAAVIDEFGNVYDEEELNKSNALGGYYTEAARSARRRQARIARMIERKRMGKKISEANLKKLQEQEAAQEAARQAAADAMQAENRDRGTGGYQAAESSPGAGDGYDGGFMEGSGTAAEMGSFMDGGIVDLVDIYD